MLTFAFGGRPTFLLGPCTGIAASAPTPTGRPCGSCPPNGKPGPPGMPCGTPVVAVDVTAGLGMPGNAMPPKGVPDRDAPPPTDPMPVSPATVMPR